MPSFLQIGLFLALVGTAFSASAQESVSPETLVNRFHDVCTPLMKSFEKTLDRLVQSGWPLQKNKSNSAKFFAGNLSSPDGNFVFNLQNYSFDNGTFVQCEARAYSKITEADLEKIKAQFPASNGEVVYFDENQFSALWLLNNEASFTSINVIAQEKLASIITMRTTYLGAAN